MAARVIAAIENPQDIIVQSAKPYGKRAVLNEPRLLILTDPRTDHQPIKEAALVNIPTIAFYDIDSPMRYVDIGIPTNNKGKHGIGCLFWLLARMVLQMRGVYIRYDEDCFGKSGQNFIPGHVKSSRILLDIQLTAKFAVLESLSNQTNLSNPFTGVVGTYGYSFRVILLEVICKRPAVDRSPRKQHLAAWAQQYLNKGKPKRIIDPELKGQMPQKSLNDYAKIVECCLHADPQSRSTMAEVLVSLESILELQEKTDINPIPQLGKTISDMSLRKLFSSSKLSSDEHPWRTS
ncbi:40S ribosomal protein SA-like protein [Tanacetum coccineum]